MKTERRNNRGFTLIEVMISMVVLLIGMLGVMGMQYFAVAGNTSSIEMRIATDFAQDLIEQSMATPYANLNNPLPAPQTRTVGGLTYTRNRWVVPNCTGLAAGANTCNGAAPACTAVPDGVVAQPASAIQVRACWNDKFGVTHAVILDTTRWDENVIP